MKKAGIDPSAWRNGSAGFFQFLADVQPRVRDDRGGFTPYNPTGEIRTAIAAAIDGARASAPADSVSFSKWPRHVSRSRQFLALSFAARALLQDFCTQDNGRNNGDLSAPHSRLKSEGFGSAKALARAKEELHRAGFIAQTGHAGRKGRPCQLYAITWPPIQECDGKLDIPAEATARNTWAQLPPGAGAKRKAAAPAPAHALPLAA